MNGRRLRKRPGHLQLTLLFLLTALGAFLPSARTVLTRLDVHGDPLPPAARLRLGTVRLRHGEAITFIAFTADGKQVLTASLDNTVRVWRRDTGAEVQRFTGGSMVALSANSKVLATRGEGNNLQIWDVENGKARGEVKLANQSCNAIALSPDGKILAARGHEKIIYLYDSHSGNPLRQIKINPGEPNNIHFGGDWAGLMFSADGKTITVSEMEYDNVQVTTLVKMFDVESGAETQQFLAPQHGVYGLALTPDSKTLAYVNGNQIRLCDVATGRDLRQIQLQQYGLVSLAFSPDGKTLASRSSTYDTTVYLWETATGKETAKLNGTRATTLFYSNYSTIGLREVAFSPDGKTIAAGGADNAARLWDAATGKDLGPVGGHQGAVFGLALTADGKTAMSYGSDRTVRTWDLTSGKERTHFTINDDSSTVAVSADGKTVATGGVKVILYDVATGKEKCQIDGHKYPIVSLGFSPDGKILASRSYVSSDIRLYDVVAGKYLRHIVLQADSEDGRQVFTSNRYGSAVDLVFSPDGKTLVSPGLNNTLALWDVATAREVRQMPVPVNQGLVGLAFSPDGRTVASELTDNSVVLWEVASGRERLRLANKPATTTRGGTTAATRVMFTGPYGLRPIAPCIAFSPDGRLLAIRTTDSTIRLWQVALGSEYGEFSGHQGGVNTLAFSADGATLISGSNDTTLLVWNMNALRNKADAPRPTELTAKELEALWTDLGGSDAQKAFQAIHKLAALPNQAVPFLGERLRPVPAVESSQVARWIKELDSESFVVRERATQELEKLGEQAEPALSKALAADPSRETRKRLDQLLELVASRTYTAEQVCAIRALEALERMEVMEARAVVEKLAGGAAGALITREAQRSLERMAGARSSP